MKVALYVRVSTKSQTVENQVLELKRVAEFRKWEISKIYRDEGISGAIASRPALDEMLKEAGKHKFQMVLCWSVDRLGRSLLHLIETVNSLHERNVHLYFHQQGIDSSTSAGKLMFSIFGALGA